MSAPSSIRNIKARDEAATREQISAWQLKALSRQLQAFAGNSPCEQFLEIRSARKPDAGGGMGQQFVPLGELKRAQEIILNQSLHRDVYIGVAPRARQSGKADAVELCHVLWLDFDNRKAAERVFEFRVRPHLIVASGSPGCLHAYWLLSEPLPARWVRRANLRLALHLDADRNACDPARIMRPIGSLNHKHDPPRDVRYLKSPRADVEAYAVGEIVGGLPDDQRFLPRPAPAVSAARLSDRPTNPVRSSPNRRIEGACRVVRDAPPPTGSNPGERNSRLNWAAYKLGLGVAAGELDGHAVERALFDAAYQAGLAEHETARTINSGLSAAGARS